MLELKILTPQEKFLEVVEFNYSELKSQLEINLNKYQGLVFTEETMQDGRDTRASLNKLKKALDDKRKEIKKECLKPYEEFEIKIKELICMVDKPVVAIDTQIKTYEETVKEAKKQEIIKYFNENSPFGELIKIEHPCFWDNKWLNLGKKIADVKFEIDQRLEVIKNGLEAIDVNLQSDFKPQIRDIFLQTFDLTKALNENRRLETQRKAEEEYKRKQEEIRKQKEQFKKEEVKIEKNEIKAEKVEPKETIIENVEIIKKWKTFSVEVSKGEFIKIQEFLINEIKLKKNINYKIES